ncbi:permease [Paenibacillus filicis]|uniref:Permease n=1 Tax=Paenibacillus gyeongsangnamensis TaxID=3388067 RepID=A0ABT4QDS1_9BACL|nr:permease [Paenibacillus filicis]MCZ8515033.1 permease [Paenibacillus filicis]
MQNAVVRAGFNFLALICLFYVLFYFIDGRMPFPQITDLTALQTFKTMLLSIILEAIPFVLLGVLLSSILQVFVSERMIQKWVPRHPVAGILFACVLGLMFPVCECGLIPVVRRLIQKGMPAYVGMVFLLTGPVVNPIVFGATYMAFRTLPEMAYARMGLALLSACTIGAFMYRFMTNNPL